MLIKQHAHQRTPESSANKPLPAHVRLSGNRQGIYQVSRLQQGVESGFQLARECQRKLRCRASRMDLGRQFVLSSSPVSLPYMLSVVSTYSQISLYIYKVTCFWANIKMVVGYHSVINPTECYVPFGVDLALCKRT